MKEYDMKKELLEYGKCCDQSGGYKVFELLQVKWHARILLELCKKSPRCFSELNQAVSGISNAALASVLRRLEESGLVFRTEMKDYPARVEYSLTECGEGMRPIFEAMMKWESNYTPS